MQQPPNQPNQSNPNQYPSHPPYYPKQQHYNPYQQPSMPPQQQPPMQKPPKKKRRVWLWLVGILVAGIIGCAVMSALTNGNHTQGTPHGGPGPVPTVHTTTLAQKKATPAPRPVQYPPKTKADLHGLAALGDASAIREFHSERTGLTGACPQPKREVTVDPHLTGRKLAEDLLAYFYAQQLDDPCGSVVFAYHNQAEVGNGYTAGRISVDVTDANGNSNVDPNASGLKYTLTLDIGGAITTENEYVITY
jgi:hypothetical protein